MAWVIEDGPYPQAQTVKVGPQTRNWFAECRLVCTLCGTRREHELYKQNRFWTRKYVDKQLAKYNESDPCECGDGRTNPPQPAASKLASAPVTAGERKDS